MRVVMLCAILTAFASARVEAAPAAVERNVVYGMYSGLALLMDVYRPAKPNGAAIVAIQGSGRYVPKYRVVVMVRTSASRRMIRDCPTNSAKRGAGSTRT